MRKIAIAMTTMMIISVVQKSLSLPFPEAAPVFPPPPVGAKQNETRRFIKGE